MIDWIVEDGTWSLEYRGCEVIITERLGGFDICIYRNGDIAYERFSKNLNVERAKQSAKYHLYKLAGWPSNG